jgi:hypothetical protein
MPNWHELVRRQLAGLALEPQECDEVIEELAAHLDDTFEELRRRGFTEDDAIQRSLCEVEDWRELCHRIQTARRKENIMSNRVTQLWLPGLLTFTLAMGFLALIQHFGPRPMIVPASGILRMTPVAIIYIPWLLSLPLVGALGAFLSHRADGARCAVFSSIVFPVVPYLGFFLMLLPFALTFEKHASRNIILSAFFLFGLIGWVLLPGAALLAGGLPVQLFLSRRSSSRCVVAH